MSIPAPRYGTRRSPAFRSCLAPSLMVAIALIGCESITGDDDPKYSISGFFPPPMPVVQTVVQEGVRFWVEDEQGDPVPGLEVQFTVRGDAMLDPTLAHTDENGLVWTRVTVGQTPGPIHVTAHVVASADSATVSAVSVRRTLELTPDSMRLLLGCGLVATARIGPATSFTFDPDQVNPGIRFELTDSGIVHLEGLGGTDYRRPKRAVRSDRVGVAELIASFPGAAPDTTRLTVVPESEAVVGQIESSAPWFTAVGGGASITSYRYDIGGCFVWDVQTTFTSRNPDVVSVHVDERFPSSAYSADLVAESVGSSWIIARVGEVVDSTLVQVQAVKVEPADTVIPVGGTIDYRLSVADASGEWTQVPRLVWGGSSGVATQRPGSGIVTGVGPGHASFTVSDLREGSNIEVRATVKVVDP